MMAFMLCPVFLVKSPATLRRCKIVEWVAKDLSHCWFVLMTGTQIARLNHSITITNRYCFIVWKLGDQAWMVDWVCCLVYLQGKICIWFSFLVLKTRVLLNFEIDKTPLVFVWCLRYCSWLQCVLLLIEIARVCLLIRYGVCSPLRLSTWPSFYRLPLIKGFPKRAKKWQPCGSIYYLCLTIKTIARFHHLVV